MTESDRSRPARPPQDWSDLAPRIVSAVVLVGCALASAYLGGLAFIVLWTLAAAVVMQEWLRLTDVERCLPRTLPQIAGLVLIGILASMGFWWPALPVVIVMMGVAAVLAREPRRAWDVGGVFYASSLLVSAVAARQSPSLGLAAIAWLFAVVWATDVFAYFAGKIIGGPKLWPRVSPKKTWSGFIGGAAGGVVAGMVTLWVAEVPMSLSVACLSLAIAFASEFGDLFESFMKRHFGVKDTGSIIPGHGGLMDRLDGFIVGAACAAMLGWLRSPGDIARGMLIW